MLLLFVNVEGRIDLLERSLAYLLIFKEKRIYTNLRSMCVCVYASHHFL